MILSLEEVSKKRAQSPSQSSGRRDWLLTTSCAKRHRFLDGSYWQWRVLSCPVMPPELYHIVEVGQQPLLATKYKGDYSEERFRRTSDNRSRDGRGQNFSLNSLDKELLQTMARGGKNARVSPATELLAKEIESSQEKFVCSREKPHPYLSKPFGYATPGCNTQLEPHQFYAKPNGTSTNRPHPSEITSFAPGKIELRHSGSGQSHPGSLPMWPELDARSNGFKSQTTSRRDANGGEEQQEPSHWQRSGGAPQRPVEQFKSDSFPFKDAQFLHSKLDGGSSSPDAAVGDKSDETRRKQASQGPYSGSMGMFAYPGTPQRLFPGGHGNQAGSPKAGQVAVGSPGYERASVSHSAAQSSGGRPQQRPASGPVMKPKVPKGPPSKWDDADKWIASPGHNDSPATPSFRIGQGLIPGPGSQPGKRHTIAGQGLRGYYGVSSPEYATPNLELSFSPNNIKATSVPQIKNQDQPSVNLTQRSHAKALSFGDLSKTLEVARTGATRAQPVDLLSRIDSDDQTEDTPRATPRAPTVYAHQTMVSSGLNKLAGNPRPPVEPHVAESSVSDSTATEPQSADTASNAPPKDMFLSTMHSRNSNFGRSTSVSEYCTDTLQPLSSHRDMGTQMTPVPSLRNSRCTTPGLNPSPSRHNTPARSNRRAASLGAATNVDLLELQSCHLEKLEHRTLGCQGQATLDRNSNWSTREEEEEESATCLRHHDFGDAHSGSLVARAVAWEEAERARYTARFHQEEARIQAWEELQKAKAEAEMRKIEMKLERMKANASEKMSIKIAAVHRKAQEMRAAAGALRDEHAAKATQRADHIRHTGDLSTPLSCFTACFVP